MTKAINRDAARLLNRIADSYDSGEYVWGKGAYYQMNGAGLGLRAVAAARFEIAGKPCEQAHH